MATQAQLLQQILDELKKGSRPGSSRAPSATGSQADDLRERLQTVDPETAKLLQDQLDKMERLQQEAAKLRLAAEDRRNIEREALKIAEEYNQKLADRTVQAGDELQAVQETLDKKRQQYDEAQAALLDSADLSELEQARRADIFMTAERELDAAEAAVIAANEKADAILRQRDLLNGVKNFTEDILGMALIQPPEQSWVKKLDELGDGDKMKGLGAVLGHIGKTVKASLTPANLFASATAEMGRQTVQMIGTQDRAIASFNRATGAGGEYNDVIRTTFDETIAVGASFEEVTNATLGLVKTFTAFRTMSKEARSEFTKLAVQLEGVGLSAMESGELLDAATKVLKMNGAEAKNFMLDAVSSAKALGMEVNQFASDLRAALPTLAVYGKRASEEFKKIAASAQAAGVATADYLGLVAQFDTFRGAGAAVGKLNALLGGPYLNSIKMVNATEAERIELLKAAFARSGKDFNSLSRYEQKAIAAALGIRDMAKANQMLGNTTGEFDELQERVANASMSQQELKETAMLSKPAIEKLVAAFQRLAIAVGPIVDLMHFLLEPFLVFMEWIGPGMTKVLFAIIAANAFLKSSLYTTIAAKFAASQASAALTFANKMEAASQLGVIRGLFAQAAAYIFVKGPMLAFALIGKIVSGVMYVLGAASTFAAGKFLLIASAIGLLIYYLAVKKNSPVFYILLGVVALGLLALGKAAAVAGSFALVGAKGILALGAAVALIGLGVALVGAGIYLIGLGIAKMAESGAEALPVLLGLSVLMLALAAGAALMGVVGWMALAGLGALALGFVLLGAGLFFVKTEDLQALATMFEGLGKAAESGEVGMSGMIPALAAFAEAADDIDDDVLKSMGDLFQRLANMKVTGDFSGFATVIEQVGQFEGAVTHVNAFATAITNLTTVMANFALSLAGLGGMSGLFKGMTVGLIMSSMAELGRESSGATTALNAGANFMNAVGTIDDKKATTARDLLDKIEDVTVELSDVDNMSEVTELLDKLLNTVKAGQQGGTTADAGRPIILSLDRDGRQIIAKGMIDPLMPMINKRLDPRNA